jgi:hypothetical protein
VDQRRFLYRNLYSKNILLELVGVPLQRLLDGETQEPAMTFRVRKLGAREDLMEVQPR